MEFELCYLVDGFWVRRVLRVVFDDVDEIGGSQ